MNKRKLSYEELENKMSEFEAEIEELKQSVFLYQKIFEKLPLGLQVFDQNGLAFKINKALCEILGLSNTEFGIGKFNVLTDPLSVANGLNKIYEEVYKGKDYAHEYEFDLSGSKNKWESRKDRIKLSESIFAIYDDENKIKYVVSALSDITERQKSELKIVGLSNIIKNSLNEIYIFDTKTLRFQFVNDSALINLGYNIDEITQLTPLDIKPEFTHETFAREIEPLLSGDKKQLRFETIHRRKNGTEYPAEINLQISEYEGKKCFTAIITNITERKHQELLLKEKNEEINNFFDCALDLLCIANTEGYFIRLNKEWENLLGYTITELLSSKFLDFVHPDDIEPTLQAISQLSNQAKILNFTNRYRCKNGNYKWIEWKSYPYGDKVFAAAREITDRKNFQEALIQKNIELEASEEELMAINEELHVTSNALKESYSEIQIAKEMAEASEKQFRLLVENAPEPIFIQIDHKFAYVNKAAIKLYGAEKADDLIGRFIIERIHPDFIDIVKDRIKKLNVDNNPVNNLEYKHLKLDNTPIEVEVSAVPINFNKGNGALVFVKDITERKIYEEKLQNSYNLLTNLTAQVPGVVYQYRLYPDGKSAFPFSSPGMYDIYEVTSEEVREDASPVFTRIHPDDYQNSVDAIMESARLQTVFHSEFRVILPKQGLRWRQCDAKPELLEDGSTMWYGIISDITERKLAEEKINEQQLLFETMFNAITDGVIITNKKREIVLSNKGMQLTFGYTPEEIIGKSTEILYADKENYNQADSEIFNINSISSGNQFLMNYKDKFNNKFPGETFGTKLYGIRGEWIGSLGVIRNISERVKYIEELKIARKKAEESDQLKTAFLHNISHEIRTPMNAITGFSELLIKTQLSPEKKQAYSELISQSSQQLISIIEVIIDLATIEAGQVKIHENDFELNTMLNLIYQQFLIKAQERDISLNLYTSLPDEDAIITSDDTKIYEIITNLVGNALKFTQKGMINFGYELKDDVFEFFVHDTGIGIPSEFHEEIFKRFRQIEITETRNFGGVGLGLSISKAYVEILGGKIWLKSEPEKGSSFFFTIPYKKAKLLKISHEPDFDSFKLGNEYKKTILIAEDEDSNYYLLVELLSESNLSIIRAINGIEAVEICKLNPDIDLVLMDMKMPIMNGFEATKIIKSLRPELPIIAQTAYFDADDKTKAISYGCNDLITKPIQTELLFAKINKFINSVNLDKISEIR